MSIIQRHQIIQILNITYIKIHSFCIVKFADEILINFSPFLRFLHISRIKNFILTGLCLWNSCFFGSDCDTTIYFAFRHYNA